MENRYARELISYYSKIGVDKFIFGDNNVLNTEKLSDVLQDYINNNLVDIHEIFIYIDYYIFEYKKIYNNNK